MTTLATSIRWLARLQARAWTTAEASALANCDIAGARCYLRRLAGQRVLVEIEPDRWRPGPEAAAWAKARPKTREGGNSVAYRAAKALRERLAAEDWRMARGDLTGTSPTDSHKAPQEGTTDMRSAASRASLLTYEETAERLACHRNTVANLVRRGSLPVVRLSATLARIPAQAVADLIEQRTRREVAHAQA